MGMLAHHEVVIVVFTLNLRSAIKKPYAIHLLSKYGYKFTLIN